MVHSYNAYINAKQKLSDNFTVGEFQCKDGSGALPISDELIVILQNIREHFGKSVNITSGYRNNTYNASLSGTAKESQHMQGTAADITISGITPKQIAAYAETLMPNTGGIGIYPTFTHIDVRPVKSRW